MSKLRINPRNKDSFEDHDEKKEIISHTPPTTASFENIQYFLDKNIHDFRNEDIEKFQLASEAYYKSFFENSQKIERKLFLLAKKAITQSVVTEKVESQIEVNTIVSKLPETFSELQSLLNEIVQDNTTEGHDFLNILINGLTKVDQKLSNKEPIIESVYNELSDLLQKLASYNIFQQKYIYRSIANSINQKYTSYHLISPEDGSFVDPKFHRVISGSGQRIVRGVSFIITDKNSNEVLKFGNIKTI